MKYQVKFRVQGKAGHGEPRKYSFQLEEGRRFELGREATGLVLADPSVSRAHCYLAIEEGKFVIVDLGSANGTWVNRARVQRQELARGDRVQLGDFHLELLEVPVLPEEDFRTRVLEMGAAAHSARAVDEPLEAAAPVLPNDRTVATGPDLPDARPDPADSPDLLDLGAPAATSSEEDSGLSFETPHAAPLSIPSRPAASLLQSSPDLEAGPLPSGMADAATDAEDADAEAAASAEAVKLGKKHRLAKRDEDVRPARPWLPWSAIGGLARRLRPSFREVACLAAGLALLTFAWKAGVPWLNSGGPSALRANVAQYRRWAEGRLASIGSRAGTGAPAAAPVVAAPAVVSAPPVSAPPASRVAEARDEFAVSQLFHAAQTGNARIIEELLAAGLVPDTFSRDGITPLIAATDYGQLFIARLLVARGARVDLADRQGTTPLMWASAKGHADLVAFLLQRGADPRAARPNGETALSIARRWGHARVLTLLGDPAPPETAQRPARPTTLPTQLKAKPRVVERPPASPAARKPARVTPVVPKKPAARKAYVPPPSKRVPASGREKTYSASPRVEPTAAPARPAGPRVIRATGKNAPTDELIFQ